MYVFVCVCMCVCVCVCFSLSNWFHFQAWLPSWASWQVGWREDWSSCKSYLFTPLKYELRHNYFIAFLKISVMRPPNYTLLMIWIPVLLVAVVVGYIKRENLHVLYETRYWAIAAMVSVRENDGFGASCYNYIMYCFFFFQLWVFVMISGQMWNHIRGPPLAHRNPQTGEMVAVKYFILITRHILSPPPPLSLSLAGLFQWNQSISVHCWDIHCRNTLYP